MVHKYFVLYSCKNSLFDAGIDEYFYKTTEKIFSKKKYDNLSPWCFSKTYKDVNGLYCTVRDVCLWLCMKCSQFTAIKNGAKTFELTSKWQMNIKKVHEHPFL